jgi:hypothetical protein
MFTPTHGLLGAHHLPDGIRVVTCYENVGSGPILDKIM